MSLLSTFLFVMLLTASLMWPSEGALRGSGLHLAVGWLAAAAVTAVTCRGQRVTKRVQRSRKQQILSWGGTIAVGLLLSGFWLSTWHVFQVAGDRRSALNLALEWTAVVAAWWIVGRLAAVASGQRWLLPLLIGLGGGLSLLGIVQHHITYSRQAAWYQQQRAAVDGAGNQAGEFPAISAAAAARELQRMDVPLEGAARELFERRLLDSSEPTGPFALANTLGGILAVVLVVLTGGCLSVMRARRRFPGWSICVLIVAAFAISYCLLLTKSRTAWVGLVAGIAFLVLNHRSRASTLLLKNGWLIFAASGLLLVGTGIGITSGAIDKEVILESPRSLQFRLLYWIGAAGVIAEEPIFGAGPGNFRQLYLGHKPVESSEEILDPHNVVLDAWCSAGLAGFLAIGLLALSGLMLRPQDVISAAGQTDRPAEHGSTNRLIKTVIGGVACGMLLHVGWRWLSGGEIFDSAAADLFDSVNLVLVIPLAALICFPVLYHALPCCDGVAQAAFACLLVHLLGAGGLQISVLGLLLLLLHSIAMHSTENAVFSETDSTVSACTSFRARLLAVAWGLAALVTVWHGLMPVRAADQQLALAALLRSQAQVSRADAVFRAAIAADPLSTDSRQRRMELLTYHYLESVSHFALQAPEESPTAATESLDEMFESALQACNAMIAADRRSLSGYYFRSRLYDAKQQQVGLAVGRDARPEDSEKGLRISEEDRDQVAHLTVVQYNALSDLQHVLDCYPTNSLYWFEFADLNQRLGLQQTAAQAAGVALQINAVNHEWGHLDRYLGDLQTDRLNQIIAIR